MQRSLLSDGGSPGSERDPAAAWPAVQALLRARGAGEAKHPGGTLLDHLNRVARLLAQWGAHPDLQVAGLCHAMYGTDGFDQTLMGTDERAPLAELIGERAEALVYLYGSCDRGVVYPRLASGRPVFFRDRFTGREHTPPPPDVRAFVEITAASELDVLAHNAELADRYGPTLHRLFTHSRDVLSVPAWDACERQLSRYTLEPGPGIRITGLDHLVLTVADIDRTVDFYERALGMRPVTFGEGRRALASAPARSTSTGSVTNSSPTPRTPPPAAPTCVWSPIPRRSRSWPICRRAESPCWKAPCRAPAPRGPSPAATCATRTAT